ncbi:D-serine deaminase, pyridoxal phosphate-dependent [Actinopolymorpha cephalotaxi]|uniref:D-serine deaminase, pyridoxal phosphate-dependent n=1 Tax=Actinopolymorpha cephalotaxi TaxID=504797 RepID=A0A1I2PPY2_9ACTN|nr:alanine racemase [Actinopolymorpha cephalotaxi]NYH83601.1 D-serine deaminase-like pyridoxal phosphate-dependent protein [Actinopolymorpha cephalotaxi]SFG15686.1 D-serine deaminase, pyridoxal phosphate-dependent [Actinopolymorpha cephalotaxi]
MTPDAPAPDGTNAPMAGIAYDAQVLDATLTALREQPISPAEKGFTALAPLTPADVVARKVGLRTGELTFPLMVLRETALAANATTMAAWCAERDVVLAPHGKTSMSPEVTARQLRAGAWGITAATIGQVRAYAECGVRRILLANQLVDPAGIGWLAAATTADPDLTVYVCVDSTEGVTLLDEALRAHAASRPLPVLVEIGVPGRRTGARGHDAAMAVGRAAAAAPMLRVVGATGYEGVLGHGRDEAALAAAAAFCQEVRTLGIALREEGLVDVPDGRLLLSAGGSTYFDVVAQELTGVPSSTVVVRSGGYVTHDEELYGHATPLPTGGRPHELRAALEVWAYVLSRPEPTRALVGAGRRDVPFDVALPSVRAAVGPDGRRRDVAGVSVSALNDQHAFLDLPAEADLAVGDLVRFGISHPCTAFDKWRLVPVVDEEDRVVEVAHTLF